MRETVTRNSRAFGDREPKARYETKTWGYKKTDHNYNNHNWDLHLRILKKSEVKLKCPVTDPRP